MKYLGLIGFPVKHSLSPLFQQAALDFYGLPIHYILWETPPQELPARLSRLKDPQYIGANVAIPYKEAVVPYLDELEGEAACIKVVNTIVKDADKLKGFNTDAPGFLKALSDTGFEPGGKKIAILGAGGAALAVGYALIEAGASGVYFINRTLSRAEMAIVRLQPLLKRGQRLGALPLNEGEIKEALKGCALIVNATPLGLAHSPWEGQSPLPAELIPEGIFVFDLIYNPPQTPFLSKAKERSCLIENGFKMLIYQGAYSFKLWTGREPPMEIMFKAAK